MSKIRRNGFKLLILIWCACLLTKSTRSSSIKNYPNDEETASKLKSILLRKLDLDEEPMNLGDTNVPNYLLDLFESNSLESNRILSVNNSNTIRSHPLFEPYGPPPINQSNRSGFLIKFNVSLPAKELLNGAEFRLYLNNTVPLCASTRQRVEINQVIQQLVDDRNFANGTSFGDVRPIINQFTSTENEENLIYRLIDTQVAEQDESKWLQFDVLPAVESWLQSRTSNFGLLIRSHCVDAIDQNEPGQFVDNLVFQEAPDQVESLKPMLLTYR